MIRLVFSGICAHSSPRERTNYLTLVGGAVLWDRHTSGFESRAPTPTTPACPLPPTGFRQRANYHFALGYAHGGLEEAHNRWTLYIEGLQDVGDKRSRL